MKLRTSLYSALLLSSLLISGCSTVHAPPPLPQIRQRSAAADPLPSWNDGAAKKSIIDFVKVTTDKN